VEETATTSLSDGDACDSSSGDYSTTLQPAIDTITMSDGSTFETLAGIED